MSGFVRQACGSVLLATLLLGGCSSVKHYTDAPQMNLQIVPSIQSGGLFSSASGSFEVYSIGKNCQRKYLGIKFLDDDPVEVGLPVGQQLELVVKFRKSTMLGNSTSISSMSTLLTPNGKSYYVMKAEYDGHLQDALLYKKSGKALKLIEGDSGLHCSAK